MKAKILNYRNTSLSNREVEILEKIKTKKKKQKRPKISFRS